MDLREALQDIEMIRTTVAGLSRKRDAGIRGADPDLRSPTEMGQLWQRQRNAGCRH